MQHITYQRILWSITEHGTAKILRVFGESPAVSIPAQIAGYPTAELGDYCFAPNSRLPAEGYLTEEFQRPSDRACDSPLAELCGNYIEQACLPDMVAKIGNYAFYDCRNLTSIEFGKHLTAVGSDAFMNCRRLEKLHVRCAPQEQSGLRQILAQVTWNVEAAFVTPADMNPASKRIQAAVFYPEYYEMLDEIAPAHIFGRRISGEGFRARCSFIDGRIHYAQYDRIFPKACAEESEQTLCRLALCRLRYPVELSAENQAQYASYIKAHGRTLCRQLVMEKQLDALSSLFSQNLLSYEDAQYAVVLAAESGWMQGSASMIRWKQLLLKTPGRKKYEFDEF